MERLAGRPARAPFTERDTAILVSGLLSQPDNPLTQLLQQVWVQVGGRDKRRSYDQQLRLAREFGPMIQYVEQGRMARSRRCSPRSMWRLARLICNSAAGWSG